MRRTIGAVSQHTPLGEGVPAPPPRGADHNGNGSQGRKRLATSATFATPSSLFESAFNHAPIGMAVASPEGRWLRVNEAFCELTGRGEAELLGGTFQDITHPDDLDNDLTLMHDTLAGKRDGY